MGWSSSSGPLEEALPGLLWKCLFWEKGEKAGATLAPWEGGCGAASASKVKAVVSDALASHSLLTPGTAGTEGRTRLPAPSEAVGTPGRQQGLCPWVSRPTGPFLDPCGPRQACCAGQSAEEGGPSSTGAGG